MKDKPVLGWREWVGLPDLRIRRIKAKVDTGARTSALHATSIQKLPRGRIRFAVQALRKSDRKYWCEVPMIDERWVTDSGGHKELRPVIETTIEIDSVRWRTQVTLTSRSSMRFLMLLGRVAMAGRFCVDPSQSFRFGRRKLATRRKSSSKVEK